MTSETKILVVDDNPGTRYATSRVLRSAGFVVLEAATGTDGLATASQADLVVLDINLPDIDGFEVCRRIRANHASARIPVIHLSATFLQEQDKVRGLSSGADGYLTHPVESTVLIATVNAFLRARVAEDAMHASEAKFRAIFDQTPHGIALVSQDFVYLEANPAMCQILGRKREQIVGKHHSAFLPMGHESEVVNISVQLQESGAWRGTSTAIRADASYIELEWSISSFNVSGVRLAIATDVTERRRIEDERERLLASERMARTEAERANRLKDDFLATISHELRTPLTAILGWTRILRQHKPHLSDFDEGLESIERNARVQTQLIEDLLDVSRITTGKLRLSVQRVRTEEIVKAALDSIDSATIAKEIVLSRHLESGPEVLADPNRLQQIVWNLVTNAVKFTPNGGNIDVSVKYRNASVCVSVRDNGRGIAPEFLPHLFDRFSQADGSAKRLYGGLGIGLAIVKNLVELHGGTVEATSEGLGKGAEFIVELPLVSSQPSADELPVTTSEAQPDEAISDLNLSLIGIRVLVVDDDADTRKVITRMLLDFDATVADAGSVPKAIEVLTVFKPHILVSDLGMPGQDGYDLVRELRQRTDEFALMPAIALTAFSGDDNRHRSLHAGFQAHLAKPVNPGRLIVEIEKLASRTPQSK